MKKIRIHKLEGFLTIYASGGIKKLFYEEFTISSSKLISTNNYSKKKKLMMKFHIYCQKNLFQN